MSTAKKFSSRAKIFVGNLPHSVTEADLRQRFGKYGEIGECSINSKPGASVRFAFLKFDTRHNAEKAKTALSESMCRGKPMHVRWAVSHSSLWVGDLPVSFTNELLKKSFDEFGEVTNAQVVTEIGSRRSKGYGFVEFANKSTTMRVENIMKNQIFILTGIPRPVRVELARAEDDDEGFTEKDCMHTHQRDTELQTPPHFAKPGTLEYEFALKWRQLSEKHRDDKRSLKERQKIEQDNLWKEQEAIYIRERQKLKAQEDLQRQQQMAAQAAQQAQAAQLAYAQQFAHGQGQAGFPGQHMNPHAMMNPRGPSPILPGNPAPLAGGANVMGMRAQGMAGGMAGMAAGMGHNGMGGGLGMPGMGMGMGAAHAGAGALGQHPAGMQAMGMGGMGAGGAMGAVGMQGVGGGLGGMQGVGGVAGMAGVGAGMPGGLGMPGVGGGLGAMPGTGGGFENFEMGVMGASPRAAGMLGMPPGGYNPAQPAFNNAAGTPPQYQQGHGNQRHPPAGGGVKHPLLFETGQRGDKRARR